HRDRSWCLTSGDVWAPESLLASADAPCAVFLVGPPGGVWRRLRLAPRAPRARRARPHPTAALGCLAGPRARLGPGWTRRESMAAEISSVITRVSRDTRGIAATSPFPTCPGWIRAGGWFLWS